MARKVDVKARIESVEALLPRARALAEGPKRSDYVRAPTSDPAALREALMVQLGVRDDQRLAGAYLDLLHAR